MATRQGVDDEEGDATSTRRRAALPGDLEELRVRSAHLRRDPKMQELSRWSAFHELAAETEVHVKVPPKPAIDRSLRYEGCAKVDMHVRRLAAQKATPPDMPEVLAPLKALPKDAAPGADLELMTDDEVAMLQVTHPRSHTRMKWRSFLGHSVQNLLVDLDLARDEKLQHYSHGLRCGQLDKIHDWYQFADKKEAIKGREPPAHIRFSPDSPVMPGSMRITPVAWQKPDLSHSSSMPALFASGGGSSSKTRAPSKPTSEAGKVPFRRLNPQG